MTTTKMRMAMMASMVRPEAKVRPGILRAGVGVKSRLPAANHPCHPGGPRSGVVRGLFHAARAEKSRDSASGRFRDDMLGVTERYALAPPPLPDRPTDLPALLAVQPRRDAGRAGAGAQRRRRGASGGAYLCARLASARRRGRAG